MTLGESAAFQKTCSEGSKFLEFEIDGGGDDGLGQCFIKSY